MKQWWQQRFTDLAAEYRTMDPTADKQRFIAVSLALHVAKGHVPYRLWSLAKRRNDYAHE